MIAPEKQHNASRGDDTNYNLYSCGHTHLITALPLPSTGNHVSNIFSAGLDSQIFWELFCSPAVVARIVLRFWGIRGRGGLFWERSSSAHLPHVPEDQWEILKMKWHSLSWYCKRKFPVPYLKCLWQDPHLCVCLCVSTLYFVGAPWCFLALSHHLGPPLSRSDSTHQLPAIRDYPICIRAEPRCKLAYMQGRWWVSIELSILTAYVHPLFLTICYMKEKPMHI